MTRPDVEGHGPVTLGDRNRLVPNPRREPVELDVRLDQPSRRRRIERDNSRVFPERPGAARDPDTELADEGTEVEDRELEPGTPDVIQEHRNDPLRGPDGVDILRSHDRTRIALCLHTPRERRQ